MNLSPLADIRFVRGAGSATLSFQAYDADGEPAAPNGTVTVDVSRSDGTSLVDDGATSGSSTDPRTYELAASALATVDRLTVAWTDDGTVVRTEYVDVVGGTIGTQAQLVAYDASLSQLSTAEFLQARRAAENRFISVTNRLPWHKLTVQRFDYAVGSSYGPQTALRGAYWPDLVEVRWGDIYSDATTTEALTAGEIASIVVPDTQSRFARLDVAWIVEPYGVEVGYVAGLDTIPDDLRRAFAKAVRREATMFNTPLPDGSPTFSTFDGFAFGLARPSADRAYGVDDIDGVYMTYVDPRHGIG